jgi:hypothetical protein
LLFVRTEAIFAPLMNAHSSKNPPGLWSVATVFVLAAVACAQGDPWIGLQPPETPGKAVRVSGGADAGSLLRLEAATDMTGSWQETGRFHDTLYPWPDGSAGNSARRFYRIVSSPRAAVDDWKNQLLASDDVFRSAPAGDSVRWVKFALRPSEPWRVYFQDSTKYPFHYEFATQRIIPFAGMTRAAFDAVTLHRTGQQLVLGTVLFPPRANFNEYAVQFVGLDAYPPAEIASWLEHVSDAVHSETGAAALYIPVYEQSETARQEAATFAQLGVTVAALDRWVNVNHVYSDGWATGRLKFFPAAEINAAFADGRLLPTDILLTDGLPAETPLVAGIISLTPQTPNSHTAILAQSFGIPFVHIPGAADQERVQQLAGRKVILRAEVVFDTARIKVIDAEELPPSVEAELLAAKQPQPILYTPRQVLGAVSRRVELLQPEDVKYFGGKAVNYGLLRRTIPANTPAGVAFSFDLWDAFLDQMMPAYGRTLRQEIAARLVPHSTWPPAQMQAFKTTLADIRSLIRNEAAMPAASQQVIVSALSGFDPLRKIRFRSSTNLEDGQTFTGAGLYDSYSGCLTDDTDGNTTGPCACDPAETEERGVFRAIQRVYASYYNDNAVLERLRHGVVEAECGMAVLVHHSYPDAQELANGVASLGYRFTFGTNIEGKLVTQAGAESVTNPDGSAAPEVVDVFRSGSFTGLDLTQNSSRVPLGAYVMQWENDYMQFMNLFATVGTAWRQLTPTRTSFSLDFEYKKDANLGLIVKQVREIPVPVAGPPVTPWLIEEPNVLVVAQRENGDIFANHRLKSKWNLRATSGRLTAARLAQGLYREGRVDYVEQSGIPFLSGLLSSWPDATLAASGSAHRWTTGTGGTLRSWELSTTVTTSVTGSTPPIFSAADFPATVSVTYATPQPMLNFQGQPATTTSEIAILEPPPSMTPGSIRVERVLETGRGFTVRTVFYWPDPISGFVAGYTAPLVKFESTTITGLTTQPIVLTDYWSQTYRPGHHNFTEDFMFEPALSPDVPQATLTELHNADIRSLYIRGGINGTPAWIVSPSGTLRSR